MASRVMRSAYSSREAGAAPCAVGAEARLLGDHQADQEAEEALRGGPGVAVAVGGVAVAPRGEDALGHQRLLALGQLGGDLRQGVQPRVAERLDLAQQDRGLGQADWAMRGASPRPARVRCSASACAVTTVCSACRRELGQLGLGDDDDLLGLLAGPGQVGLGLLAGLARSASPWFSAICTWTCELVSSVCIVAWAWASLSVWSFSAAARWRS